MAVNPLFLKSAKLTIDGAEQADAVSNVTFTPATSPVTFKGISGLTTQSNSSETWTVSLTYAQDFTTASSLAMKLYTDAGKTVTMVFRPLGGTTTPTVTAQVTLTAGAVGGAVDAVAESTVSMPITGRPAIATAA